MFLTGLTSRQRLYGVATRWLCDQVQAGDGRFLTEVFIYESLISGPTVRGFVQRIIDTLRSEPLRYRHVHSKDEVRQALLDACPAPSPRVGELFANYIENREEFFPRTPVDMVLATSEDGALVALNRLKRIRRIADKASRRVADGLAGEIQVVARSLAATRARSAGVSLDGLVSSPATMADEFGAAERLVSQAFREGRVVLEPEQLRIDDVLGSKFVLDESQIEAVEQSIRSDPHAQVVGREEHRGAYNDLNLLIELELPPSATILEGLRGHDWSYAAGRGLDPRTLAGDLPEYLMSGASTATVEVILTTFDELVESELGHSVHEVRILSQRDRMAYAGRIAQNASFIIEYLLKVAVSPTVEISELPVKMWGRYLPDTVAAAVARLMGNEDADRLFGSFAIEVPRITL